MNNDSITLSLEPIQQFYLKKDFLKLIYLYYINKGYYNILSTHITIILTGTFLILYTIFLYNCIEWRSLLFITDKTQLSKLVHFNNFFDINFSIIIFLITFIIILFFRTINTIKDLYRFKPIKRFYNGDLNISDDELCILKWFDIVSRFKERFSDNDINIYYINNKITNIDNYLVTLIDKDIININYISKLFEWNIKYCFINSLYSHNAIDITFRTNSEVFYTEVKHKILCVIILNFICMPFIINYMVLYNIFNYGEKIYTTPSIIFNRSWTRLAYWKFRNYNELSHEFNIRMLKSIKPSNEYINTFNNKLVITINRLFIFIFSSILVTLIMFSFINEKLLLNLYIIENKQLFWVIGVLCSIIAILKNYNSKYIGYYPKDKLEEVKNIINYIPNEWSDSKNRQFFYYYKHKLIIILYEIIYTINVPFDLLVLYFKYKHIFTFINDITINSPKYGHINTFSLFDNRVHVDKKTLDSIKTFKQNYFEN